MNARAATARHPDAAEPAAAVPVLPTIELLQAHSLTSVVHREIERLILGGELAPGSKLTEAMLAQQLGVSRGPIRESLRILEQSGLVRQEKNRGAFVRHVQLDEAMELYDLRAMMDEAVGRRLAESATPEQLKSLRAMVDAMERLVKDGLASDYGLQNLEFHDRLVECVGNRKLTAVYRQLVNELSLFRRINLADGSVMSTSVAEHRGIVKAIASGDPDAAGAAMRAHVAASKERTLRRHAPAAAATVRATTKGTR